MTRQQRFEEAAKTTARNIQWAFRPDGPIRLGLSSLAKTDNGAAVDALRAIKYSMIGAAFDAFRDAAAPLGAKFDLSAFGALVRREIDRRRELGL